jgi:hypothetical protein
MRVVAAALQACAIFGSLQVAVPRPALAQPQTPAETVAPVDWSAVRTQMKARSAFGLKQSPSSLRSLMPERFRQSIRATETSNIPVLVPLFAGGGARSFQPITTPPASGAGSGARTLGPEAAAPTQPKTLVFPESDTYSATIELPQGATVSIIGSRRARLINTQDAAARSLIQTSGSRVGLYQMSDVVVEQTETGFGISFTRFGVAYNVEIGCVSPLTDPRCSDPTFVRELAYSMGLVGEPPTTPPLTPAPQP